MLEILIRDLLLSVEFVQSLVHILLRALFVFDRHLVSYLLLLIWEVVLFPLQAETLGSSTEVRWRTSLGPVILLISPKLVDVIVDMGK